MTSPERSAASQPTTMQAVLAELQAAGEGVTSTDPAVLLEQLKDRIITVVSADPAEFDRAHYDRLMHLWNDLAAEEEME